MDSGTSDHVPSEDTVIGDGRMYTPAGHKSSGHGIVFHEQYLLLCAYRSLASGNKFSIMCEFEEAGKFDDLVYVHEANGDVLCEMIQYKHAANMEKVLNFSQLVNTSRGGKPYSLVEYFNSYLELYCSKRSEFVPFEQKYDCRINSCVLLTNRGLDDDFVGANLNDCTTETSLFCSGKSYRFKADGRDRTRICNILEKSATKRFGLDSSVICSRIDEFLNKFVLSMGNEGKVDRLEAEIKRLIETCLKKQDEKTIDDPGRVDVIYKCLCYQMFHFHSDSKVLVAKDTDFLEWLLNTSEKMSKHMVSVHHEYNMKRLANFGTDLFTDESVKTLKDSVENCPENIFCVVGRERTVFALLKLVQVLKETGKVFHVIVDDQFLSLSDEQVTIGEYLIVSCEPRENRNKILEKTRRVLGNNTGKKIALVIDFEDCSGLNRIRDETRWSDLTENTRQSLRHKSISFQGIDVHFSVLNVSGVEGRIGERVLDDVFRENLKIWKRFDDKKSEEMAYFVDRMIGRRNRIDLESFRSTRDVFVIENMTEPEYESFIAEKRFDRTRFRLDRESDFDDFCREHRNKNISLLYYAEKKFYWKKGYAESIEKSIGEDFDPVIDLNDVTCITDQTVLIVAEPGMGKSNLLSALLERSVEKRPDVWIVKIDLSSRTERFYDMQERQERFCTENAIEFVVESQAFETSFESYLFRSYFDLERKLIVLLDGFDEIASDYRETVFELIVRLSSISNIRVWLTSRPQEKDYLESRLRLMSYSMLEFTDEDQKEFFTRFWIRSGDVIGDRAHMFIDRLLCIARRSFRNTGRLLTGIPLQCRMLGEVYRSHFEEFYRSENVDPVLPYVLDILDLYEEFKHKLFNRCVVEKLKLKPTQPGQRKLIKKEENNLNESHKLLSLEIVFPHRFETTYASKLEEYKERIVDGEERTGIVHSLDRNRRPVFLHRTFAEYFSALWFHDELKASDRETKRDLFDYLEENMFEAQYEVFREFFDRLSVRSEPVLRHVLNRDLDSLERELRIRPGLKIDSCVDVFRRNALHLAASYKYDLIIEFMIGVGVRTESRDRLFEWTPLKYGLALIPSSDGFRGGLYFNSIVSLLPGNEDYLTAFEQITHRDEFLLCASRFGHVKTVDYLLKHGTDINVVDDKVRSPLHLAVENGHYDVCVALIEYGSQIDCECENDWTPLHYSCIGGHESIVTLLLEHGADVNVEGDLKKTPLHYAFERGHVGVVDAFVAHDENALTCVKYAETLLHSAVVSGRIELVGKLLELGADVNARDHRNQTPLHYACAEGDESTVVFLLANGADVNAENDKKKTPLHYAFERGYESIVDVFVADDTNVLACVESVETLLHSAVVSGRIELVGKLLELGADVNARDHRNRTPLDIASKKYGLEHDGEYEEHYIKYEEEYYKIHYEKYYENYDEEYDEKIVELLRTKGAIGS